jgi:hypothetical protein
MLNFLPSFFPATVLTMIDDVTYTPVKMTERTLTWQRKAFTVTACSIPSSDWNKLKRQSVFLPIKHHLKEDLKSLPAMLHRLYISGLISYFWKIF